MYRAVQPSVAKRIGDVKFRIELLSGVFLVILLPVFFSIYPQTRHYLNTVFPTPNTGGALVTDYFRGYMWARTALFVLIMPAVYLAMLVLSYIHVKWLKYLLIVYASLVAFWWIGTLIMDIVYMTNANDPTDPQNPANSFYFCCAPQVYTSWAGCPNYGAVNATCTPPRSLDEMGFNWPFMFAFVFNIFYLVGTITYIVFTAELLPLMEEFEKNGDENFIKKDLVGAPAMPYYIPGNNTAYRPPPVPSTVQPQQRQQPGLNGHITGLESAFQTLLNQ